MKEIMLKADAVFHNYMKVQVIDFPDGDFSGRQRQRCKVTIDFARADLTQLKQRGMDREAAMKYYDDYLYDVVKVNLSSDWTCVGGKEEVMEIIDEHILPYFGEDGQTDGSE